MSLAKRKDGRYVVKYKDTEGRWKQRSFRAEAEARQFDAEFQYDSAENQRLTLLECVLAYLKNTHLSQKSIIMYEFLVCGHDRKDGSHREGPAEILADKYVDSMTRLDLETVRENCRRAGVSADTTNNYVGRLKAAINWCVEEQLVPENPWHKFRALKVEKRQKKKGTLADFAKIYPMLPEWLQWAAKTAVALCLRPGITELFALEWSAFNWRHNTVTIFMPKVKESKIVYPPASYMQEARIRYERDLASGYTLVCRDRRNRQVNHSLYSAAWARARKKAGISMPMYHLRHIAASEMLANGADLAAVAAQLGHKNMTTTSQYYAYALSRAQRNAALALPDCTKLVQDGAVFDC